MKPIDEQDHYEVLELAPTASSDEVEQAYRIACSIYADDSAAVYSMLDETDVSVIRGRIDEAYGVLSDPERRRRYDQSRGTGQPPVPRVETEQLTIDLSPRVAGAETAPLEGFDDVEIEDDAAAFDGARLRRARLQRGLELDDVARSTKINLRYLRFLEESRFDGLPSSVYVRGFVKSVARCLGLDADAVARRYMEHYEAAHGERESRWFRGRR